ncbi:glutamine amidotransferase [Verrucomicrobia bacterium IMCC26134]|nr:glutamine amidotransferase [Verrucomicrobia bacterium IMCC26134]
MPTVLVILPEGFEELEAVAPIDVLRRAGVSVTVAALGSDRRVTGRNAMVMEADCLLAELPSPPPTADALFLPGGPGVARLRADPRVRALVLQHHTAGAWIAAICAAPVVLHDAGLLAGRRYTAHPSVAGELTAILASERTVIDGKILTSRGAGTALDFGLALVAQLTSPATATEIHRAICA